MDRKNKYPKSKNNFQCLGPCYNPKTMIIHPTQLEYVTDHLRPFCPVNEWEFKDPATGDKEEMITDVCLNPTKGENTSKSELEMNILIPQTDFNFEHFLKIYYEIFSFEDSMKWMNENKHSPIRTKMRIINASLEIYGKNIEIFDDVFIDFFIEYIKTKEIKKIYDKNNEYIGIDDDKNILLMKKNDNPLNVSENSTERMNYLIKMFLGKNEIIKFMYRYFKHKKKEWDNIDNYLKNMSNDLNMYIFDKIKISINNHQ
jgi:hypothetical protein